MRVRGTARSRCCARLEHAWRLLGPETGERERFFATLALGMALIYDGRGDVGAGLLRDATRLLERSDALSDDPRLLSSTALGPLWLREAATSRALVERAIDAARRQGAVGALPQALWLAARDAATSDRWALAEARYEEAIRLARETDQATSLCAALAGLACVEARAGREAACREHADEALALSAEHDLGFFRLWALDALAELEAGLGAYELAVARLEDKEELLAERGIEDPDVSGVPELVEALLRLDRAGEARRRLEQFAARAEAKGQPWALARLARCRGLLGGSEQLDEHFGAALLLHERTPDRFEEARTRLCYGEALRRTRRRVVARGELRRALETFDALGAAPWAERTGLELHATGERARRRDAEHAGPAHPARAAGGARARRRAHDAGGGREALPQPQDRRVPPAQRLPQARDRLAERPVVRAGRRREPGSGCDGATAARDSGGALMRSPDAARTVAAPTERDAIPRRRTMTAQAIDPAKVEQFVMTALGELGATLNCALVVIGDRLGLYRAMAGAGLLTPAELAESTGTDERYVREWLNAQAAGGYVTYDPDEGRYALPPEHAVALADESSPAFLPGAFQLMAAAVRDEPRITEAFRSGAGVGWHEHSHGVFEGCERFFRPGYQANLVESWIPALDGVDAKLRAGARVADVGCGHGASTLIMAEAFPRSTFTGFDYHDGSIAAATERARAAGVSDRVRFEVAAADAYPGAGYDLVDDVRLPARHGRPRRRRRPRPASRWPPDGTWLIVEPFANDRVEDNLNPVGRIYYGASTLLCTPASLLPGGRARARRAGRRAAPARRGDRRRLHALPPCRRDAVQPRPRGAAVTPTAPTASRARASRRAPAIPTRRASSSATACGSTTRSTATASRRCCCSRPGRSSTRATGRRRSPTSPATAASSRSTAAATAARTARAASAAYVEAEFAADALAVMDATATERAVLVGLSCGALWATPPRGRAPGARRGHRLHRPGRPARAAASRARDRSCASRRSSTRDEGWAKYNRHYWLRDYRGFLEFFFGQMFNEPHSTKQIEDCVGWGLETDPETLADTRSALSLLRRRELRRAAPSACAARCWSIHGDQDLIRPHAQGAALARAHRRASS